METREDRAKQVMDSVLNIVGQHPDLAKKLMDLGRLAIENPPIMPSSPFEPTMGDFNKIFDAAVTISLEVHCTQCAVILAVDLFQATKAMLLAKHKLFACQHPECEEKEEKEEGI